MSTHFKTSEQLEFAELFEQIEKFNWSQSDLARELTLSRAAVSMYLSGRSNPSERSLVAMRALLARLQGAREQGLSIEKRIQEVDQLQDQIAYLRENDPTGYEAVRSTVATMHRLSLESKSKTPPTPLPPRIVITHAEQERERRQRKRANSAAVSPVAKSAIEAAARDYDHVHGSGAPAPRRGADAPTSQTSGHSAAGEKPTREKPPATPGKAQK